MSPKQLRSGINISLTLTDQCLPSTTWQSSVVCYLLFICLYLALWVCLKWDSEHLVLVMLLKIGASDFTVMYVYNAPALHLDLVCSNVNLYLTKSKLVTVYSSNDTKNGFSIN